MRKVTVFYTDESYAETYNRQNYDLTREPGGLLITEKAESYQLPAPYRKFVPWHRVKEVIEFIEEKKSND